MRKPTLILDLDGVLITTPMWKADEIDADGYSKFNANCVTNLNKLLSVFECDIILSSTRRTVKKLDEFNEIFKYRQINCPIKSFLPIYDHCKNRKEEIEQYINESDIVDFLIIDDDKSLNSLNPSIQNKLVRTELIKGFNEEKLNEAIRIIKRS
ncbi:HAD domain-containing protein [Flammeovirga sp. SJP92]|uniref:HAD domain-containing protein n=1 Tax=Flammeovirga sp. SJP92 TaxID=1775430 RepID=UPI000788B39C|nr:HAD domain-containing protein [Flammeovirga sp. SJP92]KXX71161.1 hypothetical protein AVL50_10030 [Flammeovirga sp. SJP92]